MLESIGWYSECAKKLSKHRRDIIDVILSAQRSDKEDGAISAADTSWAIVRVIMGGLALDMTAMSNQNAKQARAAGRVQDLYLWRRAFATELNARGYDIFINASQTPLVSGWHRANREPRPEPLVLARRASCRSARTA